MKTTGYLIIISILLFGGCERASRTHSVTDIDGNVYKTVNIGKQIWMAENLKVEHFNDGSPIPYISDNQEWSAAKDAAFCWYNNDSANYKEAYGALYNYYAINTAKLCPQGWRVPTEQDIRELLNTLDPEADLVRHETSYIAGGKLKDTIIWIDPIVEASNESGFSALPGGCRGFKGEFSSLGRIGYFGGATDENSLAIRASTNSAFLRSDIIITNGIAIRCVKNRSQAKNLNPQTDKKE